MKLQLLLLLLWPACTFSAQLTINAGELFFINGDILLTLQSTDLVNNGNFTAINNTTNFTGNTKRFIRGIQPTQLTQIAKSNNSAVLLQRNISMSQQISSGAGFLKLNGFDADLGNTGIPNGGQEHSRITGANDSAVIFTANLNFTSGTNPIQKDFTCYQ